MVSMSNFLRTRKEHIGLSEADNLNDTEPTPEQIDKLSGEVDKELDNVSTDEPKEPKEDFITEEEAAKRIRGKVKSSIESAYRVSLVAPSSDPGVAEGFFAEAYVVGKYASPGGVFDSSKPTVFEVSVPWDEDEQMTELNAEVKIKFKVENNEYVVPMKPISFSIKL